MARQLPYTNPDFVLELTGETVSMMHCDMASSIVDQHMGSGRSVFMNGTSTQRFSGDGSQWLDLGVYPITGVTSVKYVDFNGSLTIVDPSMYQTPSQHGEADGYLFNSYGWQPGQGNIEIQFSYGTQGQLMELVRSVASYIAAYVKREAAVSNIRSETIGTYSVSYVQDGKIKTAMENQLELLPRHWNITAVGQQQDPNGYAGVSRTIRDDTYGDWGY